MSTARRWSGSSGGSWSPSLHPVTGQLVESSSDSVSAIAKGPRFSKRGGLSGFVVELQYSSIVWRGQQSQRPKRAVGVQSQARCPLQTLRPRRQCRSLLPPRSTRTCTSGPSCASRSRRRTASPWTSGASASLSTMLPPAASPLSPSGDHAGTRRSCRHRVQPGAAAGEVGWGWWSWGLRDSLVPAALCDDEPQFTARLIPVVSVHAVWEPICAPFTRCPAKCLLTALWSNSCLRRWG